MGLPKTKRIRLVQTAQAINPNIEGSSSTIHADCECTYTLDDNKGVRKCFKEEEAKKELEGWVQEKTWADQPTENSELSARPVSCLEM